MNIKDAPETIEVSGVWYDRRDTVDALNILLADARRTIAADIRELGALRQDNLRLVQALERANYPVPVSAYYEAWGVILKWLDDYAEEEATFSRYRDDVILDGVMTAAQRRAVSAVFQGASRIARTGTERCAECGMPLPLSFPCSDRECRTPNSR